MAYALVPDGYKLQKVTKDQKLAVDKHTSNEAIQAFFDGPASGELVKAVTIVVTPIVLAALAKRGYDFAEDEVKNILQAATQGASEIGEDLITKTADTIISFYKGQSPYY